MDEVVGGYNRIEHKTHSSKIVEEVKDMRMCKRKALSFLLMLALIVGCFAGTGVSVKAAGDSSILQGTVVDENGNSVSGVKFQLKAISSYDEIAATITSENGQIEFDVKDLVDGIYQLTIVDDQDYDFPDVYYAVDISGGNISSIKDGFGDVVNSLKLVVEKKVDPAKQTIKIKLVNKPGGELINDPGIRLCIIEKYTYADKSEEPYEGNIENGIFTYKMPDSYNVYDPFEKVTIMLQEGVGYTAEPIVLTFNAKGEIADYDGETPLEMVVVEEGTVLLTEVEAVPGEVSSDGGEVAFNVEGIGLTADNWGMSVQSVISDTNEPCDAAKEVEIKERTATGAKAVIPANDTSNGIDYNFTVGVLDEDGGIVDPKTITISQAGKSKIEEKPQTPPATVKVSSIKLGAVSGKIAAGKKVKLATDVLPVNASNKTVTYTSSNAKYASVDSTGKVTVKKAGAGKTVTITATAADGSGKSASYKIKIMKNAVKSVKVKAAKSVKAGKKIKAKATVKTTGKKVNKALKWTSSNTKYATVSSKGVIKTKKAGKGKTVKITATATDGSNKKSTVKIKIK